MQPPETRYARSGDLSIAYQVIGDGPLDLVYVPGWVSNIETAWEDPHVSRFLERLVSFSRLILFDKRGTGLSDRVPINELPTLEQRMDDVRAVMDAAGSERAALFGASEGGVMCALFAATYPERTSALVIYGSYAKGIATADYPQGLAEPEALDEFIEALTELWDDAGGLLSGLDDIGEHHGCEYAVYGLGGAGPCEKHFHLIQDRVGITVEPQMVLPG